MSVKRVILANGSRLLREMLHRVINKADQLEVVQEVPNHEELPFAIERFDPAWVIVSLPENDPAHGQINDYIANYPSVRFIFLSPDDKNVRMKWQNSYEEDLTNLSLRDFIDFLEKDLQHTSANGDR
jgi:DNA-binding NarL/FixJ family response regulator